MNVAMQRFGKTIKVFKDSRQAAKYIGGYASTITRCLRGKLEKTYNYEWVYTEEPVTFDEEIEAKNRQKKKEKSNKKVQSGQYSSDGKFQPNYTFLSVKEAAEFYECAESTIYNAINTKRTARLAFFRYID